MEHISSLSSRIRFARFISTSEKLFELVNTFLSTFFYLTIDARASILLI